MMATIYVVCHKVIEQVFGGAGGPHPVSPPGSTTSSAAERTTIHLFPHRSAI